MTIKRCPEVSFVDTRIVKLTFIFMRSVLCQVLKQILRHGQRAPGWYLFNSINPEKFRNKGVTEPGKTVCSCSQNIAYNNKLRRCKEKAYLCAFGGTSVNPAFHNCRETGEPKLPALSSVSWNALNRAKHGHSFTTRQSKVSCFPSYLTPHFTPKLSDARSFQTSVYLPNRHYFSRVLVCDKVVGDCHQRRLDNLMKQICQSKFDCCHFNYIHHLLGDELTNIPKV